MLKEIREAISKEAYCYLEPSGDRTERHRIFNAYIRYGNPILKIVSMGVTVQHRLTDRDVVTIYAATPMEEKLSILKNPSRFRHTEIASPAALRRRGLTKIRTKRTRSGKELRIAFPPGRRRLGSGRVQSILTPKNHPCPQNPRRIVKIYSSVDDIYASKAGMAHKCDAECKRHGHRYHHAFSKKACVYGLPDGSILIK